jgi:hypothetical protein
MDRDIERMVEATGASLPLAGRIVALILDSGASLTEISTALKFVDYVLPRLQITYDHALAEQVERARDPAA